MSRLDDTMADIAYILDVLRVYRNIVQSGNCNICDSRECKWKPKPGQLVRYNCPYYEQRK